MSIELQLNNNKCAIEVVCGHPMLSILNPFQMNLSQ